MKQITKITPITLLVLLGGGATLARFSSFDIMGFLLFIMGLLLSIFSFFHAVANLNNAEMRRNKKLAAPIITALIAIIAWSAVACIAIRLKRGIDERIQWEKDHWEEIHGTNESQQSVAGYPPQGVGSPEP